MELNRVKEIADAIKANVEKVMIGKSEVVDLLLTAMLSNGHILLEDVPGTGKTVMAKAFSKTIHSDFKRIQFTPDLLPSDITGMNIFNQSEGRFVFHKGPAFTNILLADEINRATPRTQSSLLECMEEKQITIDGVTHVLSKPYLVIATQNPIETYGTFPLPEAQLDRFLMQINMGFPNFNEEIEILDRFIIDNPLEQLSPVCDKEELTQAQEVIKSIYIHPSLKEYLVTIVHKTRDHKDITMGVSPRGSLAFLRAVQAYSAIKGLSYVTPEAIQYIAPFVLPHRLVMKASLQRGLTSVDLIHKILQDIPVPTEAFVKQ